MTNANVKGAGSKVIRDVRMWAGSANHDNTDWLQAPMGSNAAQGALFLKVVDLQVTAHNTLTTLDLTDKDSDETPNPVAIAGLDGEGGVIVSLLSVINQTNKDHPPIELEYSGATVSFKTANNAAVADDIHRVTFLYHAPSA